MRATTPARVRDVPHTYLHNQKKVQRVATAPLLSISLPLNAAQCNPSHDIFREKQVDDHNRQDRNGDHHVHLAHIELEEVCAAQLCNEDGQDAG